MERLTTWTNGERAAITNNNGETPLQQSLKIPVVIERLAKIEDILGNEYDLDRLRELIKADREGCCIVLNSGYTETVGGEALRKAMYGCFMTNNEVTRYTADAIAEKVVREESKLKESENNG